MNTSGTKMNYVFRDLRFSQSCWWFQSSWLWYSVDWKSPTCRSSWILEIHDACWRWKQHAAPIRRSLFTNQHGTISQEPWTTDLVQILDCVHNHMYSSAAQNMRGIKNNIYKSLRSQSSWLGVMVQRVCSDTVHKTKKRPSLEQHRR